MSRVAVWSAVSGCVTWLCLAAGPVHAYEDQLSLGVGAGYAYLAHSGGRPHHGIAFGLEASLGLGPTWSVRGALGYSVHPSSEGASSKLNLGAELVYVIDVVELVPSLGVGMDALGTHGQHDTRVDFGVHPVLGVDWLLRRELMLGLSARPVFVLTNWAHQPLYLSVMLTLSWLLDV